MSTVFHTVFSSSEPPVPRWKRSIVAILTLAALALAGYFRFDLDAPWTGRILVFGLWVAAAVGLYRIFRRVAPGVERQMAKPNGYQEFVREATEHKRSEWAELQSRGEGDYVLRVARWLSLLLVATLYSGAVCAPSVAFLGAAPGEAVPRSLVWLIGLGMIAAVLAVGIARRWWRRAQDSWSSESAPASPLP